MEISKTLHLSKDRFTPAPYDRIQWIKFMKYGYDVWNNTKQLNESGSAQPLSTLGSARNNGCGPALIQTTKFIWPEPNVQFCVEYGFTHFDMSPWNLGHVHTNPDIYETAQIGPVSSTRKQWIRSPKPHLFKTLSSVVKDLIHTNIRLKNMWLQKIFGFL